MNNFHPDPHTKDLQPPLQMVKDFNGTQDEIDAFHQMLNSEEYINAATFRDQIGVMCNYLRNDKVRVSFQRIGDLFDKQKASIRQQFTKYKRGPVSLGRVPELSKVQRYIISQEIHKFHEKKHFPTYDEISDLIYLKFSKHINQDTLRNYFQEDLKDEFSTCQGVAMDSDRFNATEKSIDDYYENLDSIISGIPHQFVFNLDECGNQDWADAREIRVIVPKNYDKKTAPFAISRQGKLSTVLHCIAGDGRWIKPQVVLQRKTADSEIYKYLSPTYFQFVHTPSGYVNSVSFEYWFSNVFIPELREKRSRYNYQGESILLMDGLLAHKNVIEKQNLEFLNLKVVFLPPHSSDQTQPLDLGVFGQMKRFSSNYKNHSDVSAQTNQIIKILHSLWQASSPDNVMSAFRAAGIIAIPNVSFNDNLFLSKVARSCCSSVRHYQQSHIDFLIGNRIPLSDAQKIILHERKNGVFPRNYRIKIPDFS